MSDLIFGHEWDDIRRMQQGEKVSRPIADTSNEFKKAQIESDMRKFSMPVFVEVVEAYGITIPENYTLKGNQYIANL